MKRYISTTFLFLLLSLTAGTFLGVAECAEEANKKSTEKIYILKEESKRPWWLGDILTFVGIVAGGLIILYQINKQHKGELKVQKENHRDKLRLEIYQEFSSVLDVANNTNSDVGMSVFMMPVHLKIYRDQIASGLNPLPVNSRAQNFLQLHQAASDSCIKLIRLFEKYEIISPELDIFKTAVNVALHDMREVFNKLHSCMLPILPLDILDPQGNTQIGNVITPTEQQIGQLEELVNIYKSASDDMCGYLFDLNVELQNIFLKKLFNNKVKKREPLDSSVKVITTVPSEVEQLKKYFEDETPWGEMKKKTEEDVLNNLNNP
ncbi:MAG: hypothetical protein FP813_11455 [Desulfurivibrio sp.]|nr:hypothetical protein [Desulfurivibrio sp.]MBU3952930.1 hypothetical protein [Pseudomonadota bacterium]MBU4118960.1 hypothetical protein [Pseudomonadota bacterium]